VVGLDQSRIWTRKLATEHGLTPVYSIPEAVAALPKPRVFWLMVRRGRPPRPWVDELAGCFRRGGDVIIDGAIPFKDDLAALKALHSKETITSMLAPVGCLGLAEGTA